MDKISENLKSESASNNSDKLSALPANQIKKDTKTYKKVPELSFNKYTEGSPQEKLKFIQDLFEGLKYYGFIILKDHPIKTEVLDLAYQKSEDFFNLSIEKKEKYNVGNNRGYTSFGVEHAKDSKAPDLKEFWHVGRELSQKSPLAETYPMNVWPEEIQDFKSIFLDLFDKLDQVGESLLEALTYSLELPLDYFSKLDKDGSSILRLLHYPPVAEGTDPVRVRAAAHEDINLITILVAASTSGLELLDRDGTWLPVETDKNNLIVDAGDMLARITNDKIPSTTHRVVNPQDGQNVSRYSMPYFIHPNPNSILECVPSCAGDGVKYPAIKSHDFLMQRLKEIGLVK
jgi:isopenicillin N synthase-like dioxygenase